MLGLPNGSAPNYIVYPSSVHDGVKLIRFGLSISLRKLLSSILRSKSYTVNQLNRAHI